MTESYSMLRMARVAPTVAEGKRRIADALDSGRALRVFERVIVEQGGDPRILMKRELLPRARAVEPFKAWDDGVLDYVDVRAIGLAASELGGGRRDKDDVIDPAVGLVLRAERGERVKRGQTLVEVHHSDGKGLAECEALLRKGLVIGAEVAPSPLVLGRIER